MLKTQQFRSQLACLGEASRFGLVRLLQTRSRFVTELAGEMGLSQSCTTRHLQALKRCGLVCAERHGKRVMYRLCSEDPRAASLLDWALGGRQSPAPKPSGVPVGRPSVTSAARPRPGNEGNGRPRSRDPIANPPAAPKPNPLAATPDGQPLLESGTQPAEAPPETAGRLADVRKDDEAASPAARRRGDLEDFLL